MRYPEPKEQTIPLLRLVLAQMGQHDAAFNPVTFAVFYEHAATTNPRLSAAFEAAQQATARLGDAAMRQLYSQHIAEADSAETERVRANMQQMMTSIAESAARTGATAGNFGATLDDLSGALANTGGTALAAQLDATRASTQAMRSSVQALALPDGVPCEYEHGGGLKRRLASPPVVLARQAAAAARSRCDRCSATLR